MHIFCTYRWLWPRATRSVVYLQFVLPWSKSIEMYMATKEETGEKFNLKFILFKFQYLLQNSTLYVRAYVNILSILQDCYFTHHSNVDRSAKLWIKKYFIVNLKRVWLKRPLCSILKFNADANFITVVNFIKASYLQCTAITQRSWKKKLLILLWIIIGCHYI